MARYLLRRFLLAILTLWILATAVFVIPFRLPASVGRTILGPFAPAESVADLNHRLGTDQSVVRQYGRAMKHIATLDFGDSYRFNRPVLAVLRPGLWRSAKLAILALLLTVPVSIFAGIYAARRKDRIADRVIVLLGLASSSIPEFVTGSILAIVVGVKLKWLPAISIIPDDVSNIGQLRFLVLPALSLALVYFGYIARMTRAGMIGALDADYTRTAVMKGLAPRAVLGRHVLRNALVPTISVIGTQIGYLFGGLIGVETIFNYNGMGTILVDAVKKKDIPLLQAAVLIIAVIYMIATLFADLLIAWINPRTRQAMS